MVEVKDEENILKVQVVDEQVERIQELKSYEQHEDEISSLVLETTKKVGTLKTCAEKVVHFIDDEDVKGFGSELSMDSKHANGLKRKSIQEKVRREKMFEVDEVLNIENSGVSSSKVRRNDEDKIEVLAEEYMEHLERDKEARKKENVGCICLQCIDTSLSTP
uniref:Uncharacterized protein n=1 Tax=Tanacetum cinerariifolium TaxID=118510 RepID=A0A699GTH8_TANCI|nr:hypothetical protein [Tanacetum cinerariifolium]